MRIVHTVLFLVASSSAFAGTSIEMRAVEPKGHACTHVLARARFEPFVRHGHFEGWRVSASQSEKLFDHAAIQNKDVITEWNHVPLESTQFTGLCEALEEGREGDITVLRNEHPTIVHVHH